MELVDEVLFVPAIEVTSSPFNIRDTLKNTFMNHFTKYMLGAKMRCILNLLPFDTIISVGTIISRLGIVSIVTGSSKSCHCKEIQSWYITLEYGISRIPTSVEISQCIFELNSALSTNLSIP